MKKDTYFIALLVLFVAFFTVDKIFQATILVLQIIMAIMLFIKVYRNEEN